MRQERTVQASIFDLFAGHEIGRELRAMSAWLDDHRELASLVAADLRRHGVKATGRQGLPAEAVLRCALLKQYRQLSYQVLAFHLEDSASFRAFARLPHGWSPQKSVLHRTISAIRAETWEQINRTLLARAREIKLERGRVVRLDSTATAALIHEPSDSSLLWDAVRVMVRLLREAERLVGRARLWWRDHRRAAKKRARDIQFTRGRPRRVQLYRELLQTTRATLAYLQHAAAQLTTATAGAAARWQAKVEHYRPLIERIIAQTEQRVLAGQPVLAGDKLVSLFEPHADIIRKGREVAYGHKLNLTTGPSGLILDLVIEAGNPADSARLLPMLERHSTFKGRPPRQAAADGSYASHDNLRRSKAYGVRDMAFHKKGGLAIEDMVRSRWVYRKLRNFRAGIEADISCLKRAYGLARCTWRGLDHFRAYVWSAVVAYNLALFARLKPA
ncbi:MAG TPA: ISNCY family transposase [Geminicoccaceae bacterium]|nr:ISNCY family transposase [Geminicoccaceae bacterium]